MSTEVWELMVGQEILVFLSEADAMMASAALARGIAAQGAANPLRPEARTTLGPVEVRMRRCHIKLTRPRRPRIATTTP